MNLPKLSDALLVRDQRVATLTFNRDDLRNALTGSALIDDICTVADWVSVPWRTRKGRPSVDDSSRPSGSARQR